MTTRVMIRDLEHGVVCDIDNLNRAIVIQSAEHSNIHRGVSFSVSAYAPDVDNGNSFSVILIVPSTGAHVRMSANVGADFLFELFHGTTFMGGTQITVVNRNRMSSNLPSIVAIQQPVTIPATGPRLLVTFLGGGRGNSASGRSQDFPQEWVFNEGTYLLRLTNVSGANNERASINIDIHDPSLDPDPTL